MPGGGERVPFTRRLKTGGMRQGNSLAHRAHVAGCALCAEIIMGDKPNEGTGSLTPIALDGEPPCGCSGSRGWAPPCAVPRGDREACARGPTKRCPEGELYAVGVVQHGLGSHVVLWLLAVCREPFEWTLRRLQPILIGKPGIPREGIERGRTRWRRPRRSGGWCRCEP